MMKLKQFMFALVAMVLGFALPTSAQTSVVETLDELKAALEESTHIVVVGDVTVDGTVVVSEGTTVSVGTMVYVVSTENPYPGVTYNKTATKSGKISGNTFAVDYEISLDGGENWFTDTTNGKAQAVTVKKDGTKTISASFQSAFTSATCGEVVHMLKDAHVQSTNSKKNNGPLRSYYGLILEGNGHTIYTDVESSGASNEYSTIKFTSYLAGTGADVRPVLKNVTINSQKNAKADLDVVSGDVTFTVSLYNVNLLGQCVYASLPMPSSSLVLNKSNVKFFDCSIPSWDAGSANAIEFYSGSYNLSLNGKCKVYGGSFSKNVSSYLATGFEQNQENGRYVVTRKADTKVEAPVEVKPSEEFTQNASDEEKAVANELAANTAVTENKVELPADVATFTVQLTDVEATQEATTKVTYTVTPSNVVGEKVAETSKEITFRLPVPSAWSGLAKVYHEGNQLGIYAIQGEGTAKYVEVTSKNFSEYAVEMAEPVAKIGDTPYATLEDAVAAANSGETIELLQNVEVVKDTKITLNGVNLSTAEGVTLTNNGAIEVKGEVSLNIATLSGSSIDFLDGAIIKNSTIGGSVFVAGNVTFRGANTFAMLSDFGTLTDYYGTTAPMKWTVEEGASVTLTQAARYGLGYGDNVTVLGNIENALTAREGLTEAARSLFMHGLVAQESKGWNCDSKFTVENAYVAIGSNNSFGNKPGNYGGTYTFNLKNSVVDASRITFYEALSTTTFTFDGCDVKMGTFMTRDADSKFTLKNSKVLSTTTSNGTDEGNYNKGELTLENSTLTYSAELKHEAGVINLDVKSLLTAPKLSGVGTININATGITGDVTVIKANLSDFTGTINVEGGTYEKTSEGLVVKMPVLSGEGTEANPYLISSVAELVLFRNSVNAGEAKYNAEGKYVALGANIDLAGENWVGIGSATADHGFMGNFDGKEYTIKNLTITNPALIGGYAYAGLFAVTEGIDKDHQNIIKNLTIENVTINTTGHIVAAAIAYPYYTIVDNVKVCGNIAINGGDYTAGALAYTRRCVNASNIAVSGNEGSYITGAQVVGGVISDIQMNGGLVAEYSNFSAEGVTVSGTKNVGGISGIIATQTLNGATVKNVTLVSNDARVGAVSGSLGGTSTISNVTTENVTGATAVIGATYDGNPVAAKIDDTYFATVDGAMASNVNGVVDIFTDVTIDETKAYTFSKQAHVNGTLTYKRGFVPGYWNTLFVPFEIPMSELYENYDVAYINDMHSYDKDYDGVIEEFGLEVIYIKDEDAILNASHPYVIRPKNEEVAYMELELSGATLFKSTEQTNITCSSAYMNFTFKGSYSKISVSDADRYYILTVDENGKQTFGYATAGSYLNPYRFYFTMESRGGSYVKVAESAYKAIRINVQGEGDTTGIVGTEFNTNGEDFIYDLQGRRVSNPVKGGIYIVNGKKVYYNK